MVKYRNLCAVINCKNNGSKTEDLLMHSLDSNSKIGKIWCHRAKYGIGNGNFPCEPSTKRIFICESHFKNSDYDNNDYCDFGIGLHEKKGRKRLKKSAIPSVNMPNSYDSSPRCAKKNAMENNATESLEFFNILGPEKNEILSEQDDQEPKKISSQMVVKPKRKKKNYIMFPKNKNFSEKHKTRKTSSISKSVPNNESEASSFPFMETTERSQASASTAIIAGNSMGQSYLIQNSKHCLDLMKNLYNDETLMDVYLTVNNKTAKAHRAILRQSSGYFKQVLSLDTTLECEIRLRDIEYEVLVKILRYIYLGEVNMIQPMLPLFFKAAKILEIYSLVPVTQGENRSEMLNSTLEIKEEQESLSGWPDDEHPENMEFSCNAIDIACKLNPNDDSSQESSSYVVINASSPDKAPDDEYMSIADSEMTALLPVSDTRTGNIEATEGALPSTEVKNEFYTTNTVTKEAVYYYKNEDDINVYCSAVNEGEENKPLEIEMIDRLSNFDGREPNVYFSMSPNLLIDEND